jgi:hypothetical protein
VSVAGRSSARRYGAFDRFQQRQPLAWISDRGAAAVRRRPGRYLAAAITYYGFFAIVPLPLVLTTVLGFILQDRPHLKRTIVDSALGQFRVIRPQLSRGSLHGSTTAADDLGYGGWARRPRAEAAEAPSSSSSTSQTWSECTGRAHEGSSP